MESCSTLPATPTAASTRSSGRRAWISLRAASSSLRSGRVGVEVPVGRAHRTEVEADVEGAGDQLGRPATHVEDERAVAGRADAEACELGLFVAAQNARLEPEQL